MTADTLATAEVAATIRALEDERYAAMVAGDIDRFAALAHPELLYTHSDAEVDTLDSYLAKLRKRHYVYHHVAHPVHRIVVVGDTALDEVGRLPYRKGRRFRTRLRAHGGDIGTDEIVRCR